MFLQENNIPAVDVVHITAKNVVLLELPALVETGLPRPRNLLEMVFAPTWMW